MPTGQMNRQPRPSWWETSAMPFLSGIQGVMQDRLQQISANPFLPYAEAAANMGLLATGDKGARQGLLDGAALGGSAVPGWGDALGFAADMHRMALYPEERTGMNVGMLAAGALPFVPALGTIKVVEKALPMDEASRMQRAQDMGADFSQSWYHGTAGDIDDLQPMGHVTNSPAAKEATFLVNDPDAASEFAMLAAEKTGKAPNVMPIDPLFGSSKVAEISWPDYFDVDMRTGNGQRQLAGLLSDAREQGFDLVKINNADDAVTGGRKHSILAVLNQSKRRGRFADFNPANADSSSILAGMGAAGLLGSGMFFASDTNPDWQPTDL